MSKVKTENKPRKKRLKKIFRSMCQMIDLFAKQAQNDAECVYTSGGGWFQTTAKGTKGRSGYFEGSRLYSFGRHYLLAKVGLELNGVKFSVVNFTKFSHTTSSHSWSARNSLLNAGHLVIDIENLEENSRIDFYTTDKKLLEIVIANLQRETYNLSAEIFEAQFSWSYLKTKEIKDQVKIHNALVTKLGLKNLLVKVPSEVYETIERYSSFDAKRSQSVGSRDTLSLSKCIKLTTGEIKRSDLNQYWMY